MYIRKDVELVRYGFTPGCQGCAAAEQGDRAQAHSAACRQRIETAMAADEEAARHWARVDSYVRGIAPTIDGGWQEEGGAQGSRVRRAARWGQGWRAMTDFGPLWRIADRTRCRA